MYVHGLTGFVWIMGVEFDGVFSVLVQAYGTDMGRARICCDLIENQRGFGG